MKTILLFLALLTLSKSFAQQERDTLDKLREELNMGVKEALFRVAEFFDSQNEVVIQYGWEVEFILESTKARKIIKNYTLFTKSEFIVTESTTKESFLNFLKLNQHNIKYVPEYNAFLITPLEKQNLEFELIELSTFKKQLLRVESSEILKQDWIKDWGIDTLIKQKNSLVLYNLALYIYYTNSQECITLLQELTNTFLSVKDSQGKLIHYSERYYPVHSRISILIFFLQNYRNYVWDSENSVFRNKKLKVRKLTNTENLFELLLYSNDRNTLFSLSISDPKDVVRIVEGYEETNGFDASKLSYDFYFLIKCTAKLTHYCRLNQIEYLGSDTLKSQIERLKQELNFAERYKLENELILKLTLKEITAFEYWALMDGFYYNNDFQCSVGRILDKFYSKNWNKLIVDEKMLKLYLKKSQLFMNPKSHLGNCENYLNKFINSGDAILQKLSTITITDKDLEEQIVMIYNLLRENQKMQIEKESNGNENYGVENLDKRLSFLLTKDQNIDENRRELLKVLSEISYEQIGIAIKGIENVKFKYDYEKYWFMREDWGFFPAENFDDKADISAFLANYSKLGQYELYQFYLFKAGIDYGQPNGSLDFDKIFEILKYDNVRGFLGGGDSYHVYGVIKLLELTFKTTLDFPKKLCYSQGIYGCNPVDRSKKWMNYLKEKKLLREPHDEPVSISYPSF